MKQKYLLVDTSTEYFYAPRYTMNETFAELYTIEEAANHVEEVMNSMENGKEYIVVPADFNERKDGSFWLSFGDEDEWGTHFELNVPTEEQLKAIELRKKIEPHLKAVTDVIADIKDEEVRELVGRSAIISVCGEFFTKLPLETYGESNQIVEEIKDMGFEIIQDAGPRKFKEETE